MTVLLTPDEVAQRCRVSRATVVAWVHEGRLARLPGLRVIRIPEWSVEALIGGYDARGGTADERPRRGEHFSQAYRRVDRRRDAALRQAGHALVEVPRRSQGRPRRAAPAPGRGRSADGQGEAWRLPRAVGEP